MQGRLFGQERGTAGNLESLSISRGGEDAHARNGTELYGASAVGTCWSARAWALSCPAFSRAELRSQDTAVFYEPVILTCPSSSSRMLKDRAENRCFIRSLVAG